MSNETVLEVCNVFIKVFDHGKLVRTELGHNVWTNTGREYSCLLKSYNTDGNPYRTDRIRYVGLGNGTQIESVSVSKLVSPITYSQGGDFLKPINHNLTTFPDSGLRTAIRYTSRFGTTTFPEAGTTYISECGLFTDGHAVSFTQGGRETSIAVADEQSPVAYHTFDPIPKTSGIELEITWELRH